MSLTVDVLEAHYANIEAASNFAEAKRAWLFYIEFLIATTQATDRHEEAVAQFYEDSDNFLEDLESTANEIDEVIREAVQEEGRSMGVLRPVSESNPD